MVSRKIMAFIVATGMATAAGCGHEDAARTSATAPVETQLDVVAASVDQTNATAVAHEFLSEFFDWRRGDTSPADAARRASMWMDDHLASQPETWASTPGVSDQRWQSWQERTITRSVTITPQQRFDDDQATFYQYHVTVRQKGDVVDYDVTMKLSKQREVWRVSMLKVSAPLFSEDEQVK